MAGDIKGVGGADVPALDSGTVHRTGNTATDGAKSGGASSAGRAGSSADTVSLTDTASLLKQLEQALDSVPLVDQPRVDAIRLALEEGRYDANPERIAEKMLELERLLSDAPA